MEKNKNIIIALPGFLGQPQDFNMIQNDHIACDFYAKEFSPPEKGLWEWGKSFNHFAMDKWPKCKRILLGYSLGGRLAMHALLQDAKIWEAAIFVSAHPGLQTVNEKNDRKIKDNEWSRLFLEESWEEVMEKWNQQPVFNNAPLLKRKKENYCIELLSQTLCHWSLSAQEDLSPLLQEVDIPILWIAGEKDYNYTTIALEMNFKSSKTKKWIVPDSGHRVPWHCPELFSKEIAQFIKGINYAGHS